MPVSLGGQVRPVALGEVLPWVIVVVIIVVVVVLYLWTFRFATPVVRSGFDYLDVRLVVFRRVMRSRAIIRIVFEGD